jgi:phi13 family phage major tail protein
MPLTTYRQAPQSGLHGLCYAKATLAAGAITYGTVKLIPGGRAVEHNPNAEVGTFSSDNAATWKYANNGDIEIGLELDALDVQTRADLLGLTLDATTGELSEAGTENPPDIAFGYIKDTLDDDQQEYVWLPWGKFTEDADSSKSDEAGKKEPQGYKLKGSFGRQPITAGKRRRIYNTALGVTATKTAFFTAAFLNGTGGT